MGEMTLDEAIQHCLEVARQKAIEAKERRIDPDSVVSKTFLHDWEIRKENQKAAECEECADDHRQLAEWLKDYKRLLELEPCDDAISRADAIDLFGHGREWSEQEIQEAIRALPPIRSFCQSQQNDVFDTNVGKMDCQDAISREDVFDKIRAEIEQITDTMGVSYNQYVSKIDVLQIIDKYKAESEEVCKARTRLL